MGEGRGVNLGQQFNIRKAKSSSIGQCTYHCISSASFEKPEKPVMWRRGFSMIDQFFIGHVNSHIFYSLMSLVQAISENFIDFELYAQRCTDIKSFEVWVRYVLEYNVWSNCLSNCDRNVRLHRFHYIIGDVLESNIFQEISNKNKEILKYLAKIKVCITCLYLKLITLFFNHDL